MGGFLLSRPPTSVEIICWGGGWLVGSLRLASVGGGHMDHARVEVAGGTVGGTGGCTARGLAGAHLAGTSMMGGLVGGCACACARGLAGGHSPGLGRGARAVTGFSSPGGCGEAIPHPFPSPATNKGTSATAMPRMVWGAAVGAPFALHTLSVYIGQFIKIRTRLLHHPGFAAVFPPPIFTTADPLW